MKRVFSWIEITTLSLVLGTLLFTACDKKPTLIDIEQTVKFPDPPNDLSVSVGDKLITVRWKVSSMTSLRRFNVFRADSLQSTYVFLDSTLTQEFADRKVQNGLTYYYRVSAINKEGYESKKSDPIVASPNVFAISIQNGDQYTASRAVNIDLTAPTKTTLMMLSNDTSFVSASWEPFLLRTTWTLSFGDGIKTVYTKFRDSAGNENAAPARDTIILDTQATILSVTENTNAQPKKEGDFIHLTLNAGESGGKATASIVDGPNNIILYDNGTNGDAAAEDGIYEVNFRVPVDADVFQKKVRGNFTDRVGNVAEALYSNTALTILRAPTPVTLFQPVAEGTGKTALKLTWTASKDTADFVNYSVYRSLSPNFSEATGTLIATITNQFLTTYADASLTPGTTYYYRVYVVDLTGLSSSSNEMTATTVAEDLPRAVVVYTPLVLSDGRVQITWTQNTDSDFASYRVFRSQAPGVTANSVLRSVILTRTETSFNDSGVESGKTYFYKIFVFDAAGLSAASNEVSVSTPATSPPTPVILSSPTPIDSTGMRLTWSRNGDSNFSYYGVYRSRTSPVDTTVAPIVILNTDPGTTQYTDTGLTPLTKYFYRVFVFNTKGLRSGSNEVQGQTR